jgi:hypothetical protein
MWKDKYLCEMSREELIIALEYFIKRQANRNSNNPSNYLAKLYGVDRLKEES